MSEAAAYPPIAAHAVSKGSVARGSLGVALAVGLSGTFIAALWLAGHGNLLRVAIPATAMFVGAVLYFAAPIRYVEYSLWLWFLTPLIRRLVDWRFGYTEPNMILIAPLLVSGVAALTLVRPGGRTSSRIPAAFILCGAAILYGFSVGVIAHRADESLAEMVYGLANWSCPLLLGLHLYLDRQRYEEYRQAITRTFIFGVLALGLYGIYQFLSPPVWDRYWLERVVEMDPLGATFGKPEPLLIRVWSTLNSPGPFANAMVAGLLLFFGVHSHWKIPAAIAGYISLLLSMVRTAWLSWFVGFALIIVKTKSRTLVRILLSAIVMFLCILPFLADPRIAPLIKDRMDSFADLGHDESFGSRADMYGELINRSIENPAGFGLSNQTMWHSTPIDSGIISTLFSLGWLGSLLFGAGVLSIFLPRVASSNSDTFVLVSRAISIAILAQIVGGNIFVGINGTMFWMFAAVNLVGHRVSEAEAFQGCARTA
ncbi:MAG: O-antigen ligase family protein [Candidatus Acidiferrales bacterium]